MAVLRKVTYLFPTDTEIRYLERPPRRGDRVRGVDGKLFVVAHMERSPTGELAICVSAEAGSKAALEPQGVRPAELAS